VTVVGDSEYGRLSATCPIGVATKLIAAIVSPILLNILRPELHAKFSQVDQERERATRGAHILVVGLLVGRTGENC
jgi:hypothetical protein